MFIYINIVLAYKKSISFQFLFTPSICPLDLEFHSFANCFIPISFRKRFIDIMFDKIQITNTY